MQLTAGAIVSDRAVRPAVAAFLTDRGAESAIVFEAAGGGDGALWHLAMSRYRSVVQAVTVALGPAAFELVRTREPDLPPGALPADWSRATLWELPGQAVVATFSGDPGEALEVMIGRGRWP
ncbi:hypothetical protein LNKW23_09290 [Paralimibaculum aggregatum]|uniref:Uncharacterized protein n=1 Tax=Paralimibaculum aggregatum TaxID=3036245 RepID=A0ABQ6LH23_9RHOB|nr:hypothetical protein [Limibaculum sp. NKW23]GMG81716.1 hypothetical protein LNKW23_09290 [Limibaculum sp. NKW23]